MFNNSEVRDIIDNAYRERAHLVAHLASIYPSIMTDATDEDWAIVYIDLPEDGQVSWHINEDDEELFTHVKRDSVEWDGHTTEEKYQRLDSATRRS
jgi:hypothetical protein